MIRLRFGRRMTLGGLLLLGCGLAISELAGQGPLHDRAPPPCVLDGVCVPNRAEWGHYRPRWRRWPGTIPLDQPTGPGTGTDLPVRETPNPEQEDQRAPAPTAPAIQGGAAPSTGQPADATPTPATNGDNPFSGPSSTPPVSGPMPPLGNGAPPSTLPGAPTPTAPIPSSPTPNGSGLRDNGLSPAPMPNPFDSSSSPIQDDLLSDPPPALPPSLQGSRQSYEANLLSRRGGSNRLRTAGLARLPATSGTRPAVSTHPVQQASATVWAEGTQDIRSIDPNADRIQQAIHHEPLEEAR